MKAQKYVIPATIIIASLTFKFLKSCLKQRNPYLLRYQEIRRDIN